MKLTRTILVITALSAFCAYAQNTQDVRAAAKDGMRAALSQNAPLPLERPSLPDSAADKARAVHGTIAFGQKGAAQKAARSEAAERSAAASQASARGAAQSAAKKANADARSASGQSHQNKSSNSKRPTTPGKP